MQVLSIGRKKRIYALAFSPCGRELAAACGDGLLRVWDLATGSVRQSIGFEETPCGYDLAYLDEDRLAFAGQELGWWDLPSPRWNQIRPGIRWGRQIRVSPDGRYLAEVGQVTSTYFIGEGLVVHATENWHQVPPLGDASQTTGGLAFSPDGRWLAVGHIARVGEQRRSSPLVPGGFPVPEYEYFVRIREVPSGRIVHSPDGWRQGVSKLAFSPAGAFLVGTAGPRLRVWDVEGAREVAAHQRGTKHFQGLAFTAAGRYLVTVSNDETVRVWETQSWREHRTFTWGIGKLLNIALDPGGFRAAAGSDRGQVVIWDLED